MCTLYTPTRRLAALVLALSAPLSAALAQIEVVPPPAASAPVLVQPPVTSQPLYTPPEPVSPGQPQVALPPITVPVQPPLNIAPVVPPVSTVPVQPPFYAPVQVPLATLQAPVSDLKVDVWSNRADGQFVVGETMQLFIRTNQDANIVLLNVDAAGQTTQLFPNQVSANNRLQGNVVYAIPGPGLGYQFRVYGPLGPNLLTVVATAGNQPIISDTWLNRSSSPFPAVNGTPDALARHIQVEVTQQPGTPWAVAHLPIQVVGQRY